MQSNKKSYVPPHRRFAEINAKSKPNNVIAESPIRISNKEIEELWDECQKVGIFAIWNGPKEDIAMLAYWLEDHCEEQVSISSFSERILYLKCLDESIRDEFISVSECYFNGFAVSFVKWSPNFSLEGLDIMTPRWYNFHSLPPELVHIEVLRSVGSAIGDLIGIDSSYQYSNNVRMLIRTKLNQLVQSHKKIITNKSSYNINLQLYEGEISEILRIDDIRKIRHRTMPLTSDFLSIFPWIRIKKKKLRTSRADQETSPQHPQDEENLNKHPQKERNCSENCETITEAKSLLKSIIVGELDKKLDRNQKHKTKVKHRSNNRRKDKKNNIGQNSPPKENTCLIGKDIPKVSNPPKAGEREEKVIKQMNQDAERPSSKSIKENGFEDTGRGISAPREASRQQFIEEEKGGKKNIEEVENSLLFEPTPNDGEISKELEIDLRGEQCQHMDLKERYITPVKEICKSSKFWQTPAEGGSSPFTPVVHQNEKDFNPKSEVRPLANELQSFLDKDSVLDPELATQRIDDEYLEQLTEELVQVFCPENSNYSTKAQKEELLQRVLKIGGNNYTYEDLRRDLKKIEDEDFKQEKIQSKVDIREAVHEGKCAPKINQKDVFLGEENQPSIIDQLIKELEGEVSERKACEENSSTQIHLEHLGIQMNQEGLSSPKNGKVKGKRGRKSLKELREAEGLSKEQLKIDQLINNGKGKSLPRVP